MDTTETTALDKPALIDKTTEIAEQVGAYGFVVLDSLYMIIGAMLVIFLLHKFAYKFVFTRLGRPRVARVVFGALYVLVFLVAVLLALKGLGFHVRAISHISLLVVVVGAVLVFYLMPFLPRLPFMIGHLVEINGVMGTVDAISTFHTTIRKFDGTMVFIPNALVMATKILNFHDTPTRRIEMGLSIKSSSNLEEVKSLLLRIMNNDERVLKAPAEPAVFVMNVDAEAIDMTAFCWVNNADWLATRSDLWLSISEAIKTDERVSMSLPQRGIYLHESA